MSIYDCPIRGTATVQRIDDAPPKWLHADPEVHITDELLDDDAAMAFIGESYEVGEPCPHDSGLHHARLKASE